MVFYNAVRGPCQDERALGVDVFIKYLIVGSYSSTKGRARLKVHTYVGTVHSESLYNVFTVSGLTTLHISFFHEDK